MIPLCSHGQTGRVLLWSCGCAALLAAAVAIPAEPFRMFWPLMVEIRDGMLELRFGRGLIRKRLSLRDLISCAPVRHAWYDGWFFDEPEEEQRL